MAGLEYSGLLVLQMAAMISGELWVVLYARKGQVYVQGFSGTHALTGIGVFSADRTREILAAREGAVYLAGNGLRKNSSLLDIPRKYLRNIKCEL